jgi:calcineurin-like phosphoesterase
MLKPKIIIDKEKIIENYNYYKESSQITICVVKSNGYGITIDKIVSILDTKKQLTKKFISIERVYYILQTQFKNILQDKKDRNQFLWDTLKKWYN